ncbi:unnamed protein product, partial [Rangifer tarandus platyrhynchus]
MAASGSPGPPPSPCPEEARRAQPPPAPRSGKGENELTSERSRRRRLRAGGPGGPSRSRRSGGGYRSALRPIVSLPRGSRQSRAREPGSSPARHLLPPLWKRPPASQSGLPGTPPPSRRPRPPHGPPPTVAAAAAAAAILARPGRPLPGGTCAPLPRVPAGRGGALPGPQGAGAAPREARPGAAPGTPREGGRERGPRGDWRARTWSGASSNCTKTTGFSWCPLAGRGMAETRGEVSRAAAESHGLRSQIASCFVSGSTTHQLSELGHFNFLYASVSLSV